MKDRAKQSPMGKFKVIEPTLNINYTNIQTYLEIIIFLRTRKRI